MIYQTVVALAVLAAASAKLFTEDATHQKFMWESFKTEHGKSYATFEQESRRFYLFLESLKVADARNEAELKRGGSATHGITKFSDLSQAEFEAHYLTSDAKLKLGQGLKSTLNKEPVKQALVDWTGIYTTPVKNQGYCGSCWAFSATEQIESDTMRTLATTYILSPEQIVQCDKTAFGCDGGWTEHAYNYVTKTGGIELDSDYPYTSYMGITGTCTSNASKYKVTVLSYTTISGESNMASYVQTTGPLSVCLDAANWNSYTGGIMYVCGQNVDHCVQAVGVDTDTDGYWKVRNSWGTDWGEAGYIRLAYGQNTCDITSDPTWTVVQLV